LRDTWYYDVLLFIHIASAITAVGANITYGVWFGRVARDVAHLGFVLRTVKFLDDRIANPAYGVLFLSGLVMVAIGQWGIKLWIVVAVILFVAIAVIGFAVFTPLANRQIALVDSGQVDSAEFAGLSRRSRVIGPALGLLVLLILAMMIFKPGS